MEYYLMNIIPNTRIKRPVGVLYVHSSASCYGSDNALLNMIKGMDPERFRAVVVVPEDGALVSRLENIGVRVVRIPLAVIHRSLSPVFWLCFFTNLVFSVRRLTELVRDENIGLIHSNTSHVFDGALAAKFADIPHLWQIREINIWNSFLATYLRMIVPRLSSRIVCVSSATRNSLALPTRFERKVRVIFDGIDSEAFIAGRHPGYFRSSLGLTPNQLLVGLVGRIVDWKGHALFIRIAERVRRRYPDVRFVIIGDAVTDKDRRFRESLEHMIKEKALNDIVLFAGIRADIANVMIDLDVLMVPSIKSEPWGLVTLEGMVSGRPVVASNRGGATEIIEPGSDGFLFDPEDLESLETLICRLLASPELRQLIGKTARETIRNRFTLSKTIAEFAALYDEIINESVIKGR